MESTLGGAVEDLLAAGCDVRQVSRWRWLLERTKLYVWPWGAIGVAMLAMQLVSSSSLWIPAIVLPTTFVWVWLWWRRRPKRPRLFVVALSTRARELLGVEVAEGWGVDRIAKWPVTVDGSSVVITVAGIAVDLRHRGLHLEIGLTQHGSVATCALMSPSERTPLRVKGTLRRK